MLCSVSHVQEAARVQMAGILYLLGGGADVRATRIMEGQGPLELTL